MRAPPAMPGSQKTHFMPSRVKAAPIRAMSTIVPSPWKAHTAPMATPRYFLNHRVTPVTRSIENTVVAMPSMTPKKR